MCSPPRRFILIIAAMFLAALALLAPLDAGAGPAYRVKDIDTTVRPHDLVAVDGTLFFLGLSGSGASFPTLWRSDGNPGGTELIKQLPPAYDSYAPGARSLISSNGRLFFTLGRELWTSDGTEAGTVDLAEGRPSWSGGEFQPVDVAGTVFFVGIDRSDTTPRLQQLWRSDGTSVGTHAVTTIRAIYHLARAGHLLFLIADDGTNGMELWRSDGTAAGTFMVRDINPGGHALRSTTAVAALGDAVFFFADDGSGLDLWRSDGTEPGTAKVKDVSASVLPDLGISNGAVFFCLDRTLWRSDGTEAGTAPVKALDVESCKATHYADAGGALWLFIQQASILQVWSSDGTPSGTRHVGDVPESGYVSSLPATSSESALLFSVRETVTGSVGLWSTDGSAGSIQLIKAFGRELTIADYPGLGTAGELIALSDRSIITAEGLLWKSDGTEAGTVTVEERLSPNVSSDPAHFVDVDGTVVFTAAQSAWTSDGTDAGTTSFFPNGANGADAQSPQNIANVTAIQDGVFFTAYGYARGASELWHSDGTPAGTSLVASMTGPGYFQSFTAVDRMLFFARFADPSIQSGLWSSDGTALGTMPVKTGLWVDNPVAVGRHLFFAGFDLRSESPTVDTAYGREPWKSDGTPNGTTLIKDINPGPDGSLYSDDFVDLNGIAIFVAIDGTTGGELWRSDGTEAGTGQIIDLVPGVDSPFVREFGGPVAPQLTVLDDLVLFVARNQASSTGYTLWRSDGTAAGTDMLALIDEPALSDSASIQGTLFFAARNGGDLWKSDGTAAGTQLVLRFSEQRISHLTAVGDTLLFGTYDALWRSDGTAAGTIPLQALTVQSDLVQSGSNVFFAAGDVGGVELWALPRAALDTTPPCAADCNVDGAVRIDELVTAVRIALGTTELLLACSTADLDGGGSVGIDELVTAVNHALRGCPH